MENLTPNQFQKDMVVRTEKGTEVVADMVVLCTGIKVNSSAYAAAFGKSKKQRVGRSNTVLQCLVLEYREVRNQPYTTCSGYSMIQQML